MKLFDKPIEFKDISPCSEHKTYKVMMKPTADCKQCKALWTNRCLRELGYKQVVLISAQKNAISIGNLDSFVLYWEESGKCKCISTQRHNFWFTVSELEGFHQRYSMII